MLKITLGETCNKKKNAVFKNVERIQSCLGPFTNVVNVSKYAYANVPKRARQNFDHQI